MIYPSPTSKTGCNWRRRKRRRKIPTRLLIRRKKVPKVPPPLIRICWHRWARKLRSYYWWYWSKSGRNAQVSIVQTMVRSARAVLGGCMRHSSLPTRSWCLRAHRSYSWSLYWQLQIWTFSAREISRLQLWLGSLATSSGFWLGPTWSIVLRIRWKKISRMKK